MESHNLTTRTYTSPTCTLIVSSKGQQPERLNDKIRKRQANKDAVDFILHLDDPDREELNCITLQGKPQQLDSLQQAVSKYIAELVAKFPLPTTSDNTSSAAPVTTETTPPPAALDLEETPTIGSQLYPSEPPAPTELKKNLPGLRSNLSPSVPAPTAPQPPATPAAKTGLAAKLLGRWTQPKSRKSSSLDDAIASNLALNNTAADRLTPTNPSLQAPYLTGSDAPADKLRQSSLDHQLHLGNLATPASGAVLTLSAIQLFDLASVLDEYVAVDVPADVPAAAVPPEPATLNRSRIPGANNRPVEPEAATTPLSRLPNLPKIPAAPEVSQVYYQTRSSRSSFMSAVPWAAAAALAVGVPLLLLDPNPNPLKEAASKLKLPELAKVTKPSKSPAPGVQATKTTTADNPTGTPTTKLPSPWQAQTVQPPANPNPLATGVQPTQTSSSKIGIAPLPDAIASKPGQDLPTTGIGNGTPVGVAPNPLNSSQSPSTLPGVDSTTGLPKTTAAATKTVKGNVGAIADRTTAPTVVATKTASAKSGQLPIETGNPGKLSVSKQPIAIPPATVPFLGSDFPSTQQPPLNPIDITAQTPKKAAKSKVKPTTVATKPKPKTAKPTSSGATTQPSFEPFTPVPRNPNLINPNQPATGLDGAEPQPQQTPPIIPNQPLQSNNNNGGFSEPAETPSLQETKRYFQGKWKADLKQPNSLQYVIQVGGKNGIVRSIAPQGEAATNYLQQSKFIKPGQKLVSPAAAGNSDQKIRVLLEPDGTVDTFIEP